MSAPQKQFVLVTPLAGGQSHAVAFTYEMAEPVVVGQLVVVPLGRRQGLGVVLGPAEVPEFATKAVERMLDQPPLPGYLLKLAEWLASYYASGISAVWTTLLPAGLEQKPRAGAKSTADAPVLKLPPLTPEQAEVLAALRADSHRTQLLQGVTGSGKTRIYLDLAAEALAAGRSVIILVPEIMLTPQLVGVFTEQFGHRVLATHSRMTVAQRRNVWLEALHSTEPRVAIGPRSALFVPVPNPGLIVIDECHETSYKQEQAPRYHAVPAAAKLAELTDARLVLGSATPGLTELFLAGEGRIGHHRLHQRINKSDIPIATIVDLRDKTQLRQSRFLSEPLIQALSQTLDEGRQSLLFINRRGSASSQLCGACGHVSLCPHCQLPFTFHADLARLVCHHCNRRQSPAAVCPECGAAELMFLGGGTKRIESEITRLFPTARLSRIDRDSATPEHMAATWHGLKNHTLDIVIGTQMIAKGLDLPRIDTIGVVSADTMLQLPDYSAAERTYDLLVQVAGRAGRGDRPGRVIIQSYTPDHPAIQAAAALDFDAFATAELAHRQQLGYPPYRYLLKLTTSAASRATCERKSAELAQALAGTPHVTLLGPAPALLETMGGRYHWILVAKSPDRRRLVEIAANLPAGWTADLDPLNLL